MRFLRLVYFLTVVSMTNTALVRSEHLTRCGKFSYPVDSTTESYVPISAVMIGSDTVFSGSGGGLFSKRGAASEWQEVIATQPENPDWWTDCYLKERLDRMFWPGPLWVLPVTNKLLVYDSWCDVIMEIVSRPGQPAFAQIWRDPWKESYIHRPSIQGDLMLSNGDSEIGYHIDVRKVSDPHYFKRIFMVPLSREAQLDSVGVFAANCSPVMNPVDSTIWVEIWGFDYIYVLEPEGTLVDSVKITADDWIPPGPPVSRIKSRAVDTEWRKRWTPQTSFNYAPPGYFLMQYRIGWQHVANDSIPLYSTAVWNADSRQPVELEVDHRWQLAGVQPDGRIIFGHYEIDADTCRVVLDITRIEP